MDKSQYTLAEVATMFLEAVEEHNDKNGIEVEMENFGDSVELSAFNTENYADIAYLSVGENGDAMLELHRVVVATYHTTTGMHRRKLQDVFVALYEKIVTT